MHRQNLPSDTLAVVRDTVLGLVIAAALVVIPAIAGCGDDDAATQHRGVRPTGTRCATSADCPGLQVCFCATAAVVPKWEDAECVDGDDLPAGTCLPRREAKKRQRAATLPKVRALLAQIDNLVDDACSCATEDCASAAVAALEAHTNEHRATLSTADTTDESFKAAVDALSVKLTACQARWVCSDFCVKLRETKAVAATWLANGMHVSATGEISIAPLREHLDCEFSEALIESTRWDTACEAIQLSLEHENCPIERRSSHGFEASIAIVGLRDERTDNQATVSAQATLACDPAESGCRCAGSLVEGSLRYLQRSNDVVAQAERAARGSAARQLPAKARTLLIETCEVQAKALRASARAARGVQAAREYAKLAKRAASQLDRVRNAARANDLDKLHTAIWRAVGDIERFADEAAAMAARATDDSASTSYNKVARGMRGWARQFREIGELLGPR